MGCPSLAQMSCQSEEISQSKSRAEHYWLEAYPTSLSSVVLIYAPNCPALPYDKASRGAGQPTNGTATRVSAARSLLLAGQLT